MPLGDARERIDERADSEPAESVNPALSENLTKPLADGSAEEAPEAAQDPGVSRVLLGGVFWRILIIELILLAGSLAVRAWSAEVGGWELFWYAVRIMLLVAVIILFMWLTLSVFLKSRIIAPLETITRANQLLRQSDPAGRHVELPPGTPREIKDIAASREGMVTTITRIADERLRLVDFIKKTFGRYLSDKVVEEILSSPQGPRLGGRRQEVTILMSDLRGFTSKAAERDPEETVALLNRYLAEMSQVILSYDGVIDEFIGDAILAIFGIPEPKPGDAARAVACALAMQIALAELNRELREPLEMGIALNTGSVVVGNIGSEMRLKYGVVGSPVNLTSRLESLTVGGQVLIGQSTFEKVRGLVSTGPAQTNMMKGFSQPLVSHAVLAMGPPYGLRLPEGPSAQGLVPLDVPLVVYPVSGKMVAETGISGVSTALGEGVLEIKLPVDLALASSLKLNLELCAEAHCFGDIYAKVSEVRAGGEGRVHVLRFTAISSQDRAMLARWREQAA